MCLRTHLHGLALTRMDREMRKFVMAAMAGALTGVVATTQIVGPLLAQEGAENSNV